MDAKSNAARLIALPDCGRRTVFEDFGNAGARRRSRAVRERVWRKKSVRDDFAVWLGRRALAERAHHIDCHMIALRRAPVPIDAEQSWRVDQFDIAFLAQFTFERCADRFAGLDAAAR